MAPITRPSWVRRTRALLRTSVWAPVATKVCGLALALLVLSGVGVASISSGRAGVRVPLAGMLGGDLHAAWLSDPPSAGDRGTNAKSGPIGAGLAAQVNPSPGSAAAETLPGATATKSGDAAASGTPTDGTAGGITQDGKVILNLATAADLRHLPGVGSKRADAIVALRARLGRFKHVNDLLRVKGIGVRGLKKLLPHVLLDAPQTQGGPSANGSPTGHA